MADHILMPENHIGDDLRKKKIKKKIMGTQIYLKKCRSLVNPTRLIYDFMVNHTRIMY